MTTREIITQAIIPICSGIGIWATAGKRYRLGFTIGLLGQPFWLIDTYMSGKWGMFAVSVWFSIQHIRGLRNHQQEPRHPATSSFQNLQRDSNGWRYWWRRYYRAATGYRSITLHRPWHRRSQNKKGETNGL